MIHKFCVSNKNILIIFLISSIILLTYSCEAPRRGSYQKYKRYGNSMYTNRSNNYRAKRNAQPIAKNYRIRNTRTSGRY